MMIEKETQLCGEHYDRRTKSEGTVDAFTSSFDIHHSLFDIRYSIQLTAGVLPEATVKKGLRPKYDLKTRNFKKRKRGANALPRLRFGLRKITDVAKLYHYPGVPSVAR